VRGILYAGSRPVAVGAATVPLDDPAIQWVRAVSLIRELSDCTIISFADLDPTWDGTPDNSPTH
jgi:hypothetical protein